MFNLSYCLKRIPFTFNNHPSINQQKPFIFNSFIYAHRRFSFDNNKCQCGTNISDDLTDFFIDRTLPEITQNIKCRQLNNNQFSKISNCKLFETLNEISIPLLRSFPDVVHIGDYPSVYLEPLNPIPKGDLGDCTGDHGKQLAKFFDCCLKKNYIPDIGSILDIGGQNSSTVLQINSVLNKKISSLIIDINPITPAVSKERADIKYVIEDAFTFFSSEQYQDITKKIINEKPTLFICNNLINVLKANEGWSTLHAIWKKIRENDFLIISGLNPHQLIKHKFTKKIEIDGIVEYHWPGNAKGFYKSALSKDFFSCVEKKLINSSLVESEDFEFSIQAKKNVPDIVNVEGRRLLVVRKNKE